MNAINEKQSQSVMRLILAALVNFKEVVRYLFGIDKKVFFLAVFSKFLMKVLNFIAMVLPIKIILFLAPRQKMPMLLQPWFESKAQLVFVLCILTVVFFILANVFGKVVELAVKKKVYKLTLVSDGLDKKQSKKIRGILNKSITAVAMGLFAMSCMLVVGWLYPDLLLVYLLFFILFCIVIQVILKSPKIKQIKNKPAKIFRMGADICFFGVFFFIVYDSLVLGVNHGFITMIVSLILMRQSSAAVNQFSLTLSGLYKQRNILFQ